MIGVIGEILVDMIGETKNGEVSYLRRAGGAPFNVACAAKKMGADVAFFGSIGHDQMGEYLSSFAERQDLDSSLLEVHDDANTTLAFVTRDESGERSFSFYREHTADDAFSGEIPSKVERADILHFGTLMLSTPRGRAFAKKALEEAKSRGQFISMDVNYRDDVYANPQEALKTYREFLPYADLLKFSEEEVALFGADDPLFRRGEVAILVSLGKDGSKLLYRGKEIHAPSISVKPIDTTGAGDAFLGAFLSRLDGEDFRTWDEEAWREALRFANVVGALNTLHLGAIDGLPSLQKARSYLEENQ